MHVIQGSIGIATIILIGFVCSRDRKHIKARPIFVSAAILVTMALVLRTGLAKNFMLFIASVAATLSSEASKGIETVFGRLASLEGHVIFATAVLPAIIYFSALMSAFHYKGWLQKIEDVVARGLKVIYGDHLSGSEAVVSAANIFAGQTEAPLAVQHRIRSMTSSQLVTTMAVGFATISPPLCFVYSAMLGRGDESVYALYLSKLLGASMLSIPAAILLAKLLEPETAENAGFSQDTMDRDQGANEQPINTVDALIVGSQRGFKLAVNIAALLITIGAILALVDWFLVEIVGGFLSHIFESQPHDGTPLKEHFHLQNLLGKIFYPIAWLIGVEPERCGDIGRIMGTEVIATEFIAFRELSSLIGVQEGSYGLSLRTTTLAIYALCGFASIPSIAVQVAALCTIAPGKKRQIIKLAPRAMIAGLLGSWLTAAIVCVFSLPEVTYKEPDKLRIGYSTESPFAYKDEDGNRQGISLELAQRIAETVLNDGNGVEIDFVERPFSELIPRLESGEIDVIATGMFITDARQRVVIFSHPTVEVSRGVMGRAGRCPNSFAEIRNQSLRIGVVHGGVAEQDAIAANIDPNQVLRFDNIPAAIKALEDGEIDVLPGSVSTLQYSRPVGFVVEEMLDGRKAMQAAFAFRDSDQQLKSIFDDALKSSEIREFRIDLQKRKQIEGINFIGIEE